MLVLAPAACILSGIALSQAFDVFTRSIKFQLPNPLDDSHVDVSIYSLCFTNLALTLHSYSHSMRLPCSCCVFKYQEGKGCDF